MIYSPKVSNSTGHYMQTKLITESHSLLIAKRIVKTNITRYQANQYLRTTPTCSLVILIALHTSLPFHKAVGIYANQR